MLRRALLALLVACGEPAPTQTPVARASAAPLPSAPPVTCDTEYQPQAAWSGRAAVLPPVPASVPIPVRAGDDYTVYGAVHSLHSLAHAAEVTSKPITIVGVVVDTNVVRAPKCLLHMAGHADPPNCPNAEVPAFTIADSADATPRIRVVGWASNYANVYTAYMAQKKHASAPVIDELWATPIPSPLPGVGAKVRVTGHYGAVFSRASSGIDSDPRNGILTFDSLVYVQPVPLHLPQLP